MVQGSRLDALVVGFESRCFEIRVYCLWLRFHDSGFRVYGLGFCGLEYGVYNTWYRVQGIWHWVYGLGFRV
jgi:hypothetical protein